MDNLQRWRDAAGDIFWHEAPKQVLDDSKPPFYRWFPDGVTNACYNALDVHVDVLARLATGALHLADLEAPQ